MANSECLAGISMSSAIIPIKSLDFVKQRLSPVFSLVDRQRLCLAMLKNVIKALWLSGVFNHIGVISKDKRLLPWLVENSLPAELIFDCRDNSLNDAATIGGIHSLHFGNEMLFIHGDLPLIQPEDVLSVMDTLQNNDVVLVADQTGLGTTALASRLPLPIATQFGPSSLDLHKQKCREVGLRYQVIYNERMGKDIDKPENLLELSRLFERRTSF